jgi:hypothetical protein
VEDLSRPRLTVLADQTGRVSQGARLPVPGAPGQFDERLTFAMEVVVRP